jgi:uncharacterized protein (TIGR01777 family)
VKVVIAGSSGLIGTALGAALVTDGDEVVRLVRRPARSPGEVTWDPDTVTLDPKTLDGADAVVNLAGAGIGDRRWTDDYKRLLLSSRVNATRTLVEAMLAADTPPHVLVNASAEGCYGDRGDEVLTERSHAGSGFTAELCLAWEAEAARVAEESSGRIREVRLRTGLVMSPRGGTYGRMKPLVLAGLGGPLGSGSQWWSWVSLDDEVSAIRHLIGADVSGPVNVSAPEPVRQREFMAALGRALHRPSLVPAPGFALRVVLGEFASEVLASIRMTPDVLQRNGFQFSHPDLTSLFGWLTR